MPLLKKQNQKTSWNFPKNTLSENNMCIAADQNSNKIYLFGDIMCARFVFSHLP